MGKEWLYWSGSGGGGGGGKSATKRGAGRGVKNTTPTGCMTAVFQLLDNLHPFQFGVPHQPSPDSIPQFPEEPNIVLKGVEAPRNSLELELPPMGVASSPSTMKQLHSLNIPMGIQINTSTGNSKSRTDDLSSECSSSPGTKTPNLVARLMGLDLLPELSSPRPSASSNYSTSTPNPPSKSSSSSSHHCRSLPETPRISVARRSDADNYHHRHSLQVNKENIFTNEEFELSSYLNAKLDKRREYSGSRNEEEITSSRLYAKQIVKQVKENISRRVGADITNTMAARKNEHRRDEHLVLLKSKKPLTRMGSGQQDESTLSCSPRLRFLEVKTKPAISPSSTAKGQQNSVSPKLQAIAALKAKENEPQELEKAKKLKRVTSEKYDFRSKRSKRNSDVIKNKQEEPFIRSSSTSKVKLSDKKCRKTPLSNNLVNINSPKLLSIKKYPSPSTSTLSKNQVLLESSTQLSRSESRTYNISKAQYNGGIPTVEYISRLLSQIGIDKTTLISIKQWYSPSHPLHPSIFQRLHLSSSSTTTALPASSSSRLMFDLVDELLSEILKPCMNLRPWVTPVTLTTQMSGRELTEKLSRKIGSFPAADCRVLEDIDVLIDGDLCRSTQQLRLIAFEEEGEEIVREIEGDIVDTLVHETVMLMWQDSTRRGGNRVRGLT